jgi:hypothetical protein
MRWHPNDETFGSSCWRRPGRVSLATFGRDSERDVRNAVTACRADGPLAPSESRCMTRARGAECRFNVCVCVREQQHVTTGSEPQRGCVLARCSRSVGIDWWAPPTPHSAGRLWYALYSQPYIHTVLVVHEKRAADCKHWEIGTKTELKTSHLFVYYVQFLLFILKMTLN